MEQSHFSLAQATKRTRSMYLSRLASTVEGADGGIDGPEGALPQEAPRHRSNGHSNTSGLDGPDAEARLAAVFGRMAELQRAWAEQHGGGAMPQDVAKAQLVALFKRQEMQRTLVDSRNGPMASAAAGASRPSSAAEASSMDDAAPPSRGFESGAAAPHSGSQQRTTRHGSSARPDSAASVAASAASSGRGFFLNGKRRHELVATVLAKAGLPATHDGAPPSHLRAPQYVRPVGAATTPAAAATTATATSAPPAATATTADALDSNRFKYNARAEVQRQMYRSWRFRDQLHQRHSTRTVQQAVAVRHDAGGGPIAGTHLPML